MEILKNPGNKILVVQTAFLGDAILTLPMIQKLKEQDNNSTIDVVCIPASKEIFQLSAYVNEIIVIDKKGRDKFLFSFLKFAKEIRARKYDKIYSPHRSFRTSLLIIQSGVKETYGFSNSSLAHVYKYLVEYESNHHEVQRNLDLIGYDYSENNWKILPEIKSTEISETKVNEFLKRNKVSANIAAIAPGSIWNTKRYPLEYYEEIMKYLFSLGLTVIIIGGNEEKEVGKSLELKYKGNIISAAGNLSITDSITLLKKSQILISNDSAPTHLGICADIPVLTIYCSTVPDFGFYPYNMKSRWLSYSDLDCKPCGIHGFIECPLKHFQCGYKLDPDLAISTIKEILNA
ncbi:MAG: glycosyltransferase family 9 protein [Ignavibacteriaceae bacterium]|nr:glycosyltransferase family 9 protein [Ignavibacteriaceae bacterium]